MPTTPTAMKIGQIAFLTAISFESSSIELPAAPPVTGLVPARSAVDWNDRQATKEAEGATAMVRREARRGERVEDMVWRLCGGSVAVGRRCAVLCEVVVGKESQ